MYDYEFVPKSEWKEFKAILTDLIHDVQDDIREDYFTFQPNFNVGSASKNLVTRLKNGNTGFDLDCNIYVNDEDENYKAQEIKNILMESFNKFGHNYNFDFCEDNTRVFTIKIKDRANSQIVFSCDFAIVYDYKDKKGNYHQQYIRHNKKNNTYTWENQPESFYSLDTHVAYCSQNVEFSEIKKEYLRLKNLYGPSKPSREVYAETYNNIYMRYHG